MTYSCNGSTTSAFTRFRKWDEAAQNHTLNTPITNSSEWTALNIILVVTGTVSSFCALLITNAISDILLSTTVMLVIVARKLQL